MSHVRCPLTDVKSGTSISWVAVAEELAVHPLIGLVIVTPYSPGIETKGLEIIGIAMPYDRPDYVMEMVKHAKIPYLIAFDLKGEAVRAFDKVSLTPTTFLIDDKGKIVKKKIGEMKMDVWKKRINTILNKKKS